MSAHPKALKPLFLTELWERYGFYLVQGLLILYMTNAIGFTDRHAYHILGQFTALVYLSPIIGGFIADRILGYRYSILIGAILLGCGYALVATTQRELLFWGLATIIIGSGFLKPNISSFLGEFYQPHDTHRKSGFTIFYMGINLGSMLATLSGGYIQRYLGWQMSYVAAAIGMMIAIITYLVGYKVYGDKGYPPTAKERQSRVLTFLSNRIVFIIGCGLLIALAYLLLKDSDNGEQLFMILGGVGFLGLLALAFRYQQTERRNMIALLILFVFSIVFWAEWFQIFFSMNLFVERSVDRHLFGHEIPPVAFISLEAIFVVGLSPLFAWLWQRLQQHNINVSYQALFAGALLAMSIGFGILLIGLTVDTADPYIHAYWLIAYYLAISCGELLLSPIGLAMITELAPANCVGLLMGMWFFTLGLGGSLAGYLASFASIPKTVVDPSQVTHIYQHAISIYMLLALGFAVLLIAISPLLRKLLPQP